MFSLLGNLLALFLWVLIKHGRLVLGYAYPAFQCYKTVEKNRVQIDELRHWCQYW